MSQSRLTPADESKNYDYWCKWYQTAVEVWDHRQLSQLGPDRVEAERKKNPNLQFQSELIFRYTIACLMMGNGENARLLAAHCGQLAQQALLTEGFQLIYTGIRSEVPPILIEGEKARGRMDTLGTLFYARWIETGARDETLWTQAASAANAHYNLNNGREVVLDDLMLTCLLAGLPDQARDLFRRSSARKKPVKVEDLSYRGQLNALALLAEWLTGNDAVEESAHKALEFWAQRSRKWFMRRLELQTEHRLGWALLHARYISGTTELQPFVDNLKGFSQAPA